jgi:predicted deacetylase
VIPGPAQYILRFDDLCPTHDHSLWNRFETLIAEFRMQPILAIVPDNRDPELDVAPPDPEFWPRMRALQAAGATMALHGFRHLCISRSRSRSLVPLCAESEFACVPETTQREWIRQGLEILRKHGLNPTVWVAPRHGFDRATLCALRTEGISIVSDGFAHRPFLRDGLVWIPQQLWAPVAKSAGLWTICLHANSATNAQLEELRNFLNKHSGNFTSVEPALKEWKPKPLDPAERIQASAAVLRIRTRKLLRRLLAPT